MKNYRIALIGNPNCGKTTIFNILCGAHQHVGNYSGVTVERIQGNLTVNGVNFEIIDLPGIYGMGSVSPEEKIAVTELTSGHIDLIINVLDSGNLQRNFYLTSHLIELGLPMLLVFNMADEAKEKGLIIDIPKFEKFFGVPVIETVGTSEYGINRLKVVIKKLLLSEKIAVPIPLNYSSVINNAVNELTNHINEKKLLKNSEISSRYFAIKLLEDNTEISKNPAFANILPQVKELQNKMTARYGADIATIMADRRYGIISGACREAVKINRNNRLQISDFIDRIVTNRFLGLPIFFIVMFLMFAFTFALAKYPESLLEFIFGHISEAILNHYPANWPEFYKLLVVDGIIGGVGGVLIFLPNILLLFLSIAFLEETGYMARAAFIMDGFMHKFGLHGKSFIPMILGFGCTVPAILATRTIESKKDRLTTIMVLPLMSCGARLPIYALFIPAFFALKYQSLVLWSIYILGIVLSLMGAKLLKATLFKGDEELFIMELPPYRLPRFSSLMLQMWERTVMYLKKAGTVILFASIILYIMNVFPEKKVFDTDYKAAELKLKAASDPKAGQLELELAKLEAAQKAEKLEYSAAGRLGKAIAKITSPLGFDWKVSSALVGAFAGKELFVSQLGILFSVGDADSAPDNLREKISKAYTPLQGLCIMIFCLISVPCVATLAAVKKESGSWLLMLLQMGGLTLLAYLITLSIYQIGLLFS